MLSDCTYLQVLFETRGSFAIVTLNRSVAAV